MNKAVVVVVLAACVVALILTNVEGQFGTARRSAVRSYYQNYYQDYLQQVYLRRFLNELVRVGDFARYVNFLPLLLAIAAYTNRTSGGLGTLG